jgi:hypothetical protein
VEHPDGYLRLAPLAHLGLRQRGSSRDRFLGRLDLTVFQVQGSTWCVPPCRGEDARMYWTKLVARLAFLCETDHDPRAVA